MKGSKFYALVGGIAIASTCWSTCAFAGDQKKSAGQTGKFNEIQAGGSARGVRLDELFDAFKRKATTETAAPVEHKSAVKKGNQAIVPAVGKKPVVILAAGGKHTHKHNTADVDTMLKAFHKTNSGQTQLAMSSSSGVSSSSQIISASLDKPGTLPKYKSGDRMVLKLSAAADCNILVFDYDSKGTLTQLYPNDFEPTGTMRAGSQIEIGGAESKYTLDVAGKGIERIFVYAYPTSEQPITVAMSPVANTPFRSIEMTPDEYKQLLSQSRSYYEFGSAKGSRAVQVKKPGIKTSSDRSVKVTAKSGVQAVSTNSVETEKQPNKLELTFQIDR